MPKAIISDASCFILFQKIDSLDLLAATYGTVYTTPTVAAEVRFALPDWVDIVAPVDRVTEMKLAAKVDLGEASAIALALEFIDPSLILDDLKARKLAKNLGLDVTGSVGVILKAKSTGLVPAIRPFILAIRSTSFRLSPDIEKQAFLLAGEDDQ